MPARAIIPQFQSLVVSLSEIMQKRVFMLYIYKMCRLKG